MSPKLIYRNRIPQHVTLACIYSDYGCYFYSGPQVYITTFHFFIESLMLSGLFASWLIGGLVIAGWLGVDIRMEYGMEFGNEPFSEPSPWSTST